MKPALLPLAATFALALSALAADPKDPKTTVTAPPAPKPAVKRSEEHTSELQSH